MNFSEIRENLLRELDPYLDRARERWESLSLRDQYIALALGVGLLFTLLFAGVFYPVKSARDNAMNRFVAKNDLSIWMQNVAPEAKKNRAGATSAGKSNQGMLAVVSKLAGSYSLKLERYEPDGDDSIKIWMEDMPFNNIMLWLDDLQKKNGIGVESVTIDSRKESGLVNAKLVLKTL